MKTSEKWHHTKYKWKKVRIKATLHEGWEERVARLRRRQRGWGEGGGKGKHEGEGKRQWKDNVKDNTKEKVKEKKT